MHWYHIHFVFTKTKNISIISRKKHFSIKCPHFGHVFCQFPFDSHVLDYKLYYMKMFLFDKRQFLTYLCWKYCTKYARKLHFWHIVLVTYISFGLFFVNIFSWLFVVMHESVGIDKTQIWTYYNHKSCTQQVRKICL